MVRGGGLGPASVAQPAEQLICNQQVVGSSPSASSSRRPLEFPWSNRLPDGWPLGESGLDGETVVSTLGGFPSGQRGQTVNLMAMPSKVQILHPPLKKLNDKR